MQDIRQIGIVIAAASVAIAFTWEIASVMRPDIVAGSSVPFITKVLASAAALSLTGAGVWLGAQRR